MQQIQPREERDDERGPLMDASPCICFSESREGRRAAARPLFRDRGFRAPTRRIAASTPGAYRNKSGTGNPARHAAIGQGKLLVEHRDELYARSCPMLLCSTRAVGYGRPTCTWLIRRVRIWLYQPRTSPYDENMAKFLRIDRLLSSSSVGKSDATDDCHTNLLSPHRLTLSETPPAMHVVMDQGNRVRRSRSDVAQKGPF